MSADEQAIRDVVYRWAEATKAGDVETVLQLMTDDAVFLGVRRPPLDKQSFAAAMRANANAGSLEASMDIQEIRIEGNLAWCWNEISIRFTPQGSTETMGRSGASLAIYSKGGDGQWRLQRDANLMG